MAELNHLTAARITYAIGENSYAIDRATLQSWLVQGEDGTCTISQDEAAAFVRHMAYETDTFGLAHTFKTSLGATINLNAGGDYGWCIDKEETTQALLQAIEDETQGNLDPVYLYTANDRSANDIGNTYVEVCISQQKMWCYKDGVLVTETPVTTVSRPFGILTSSGLTVWIVSVVIWICPRENSSVSEMRGRRAAFSSPDRNGPIIEFGFCISCGIVPSAMT